MRFLFDALDPEVRGWAPWSVDLTIMIYFTIVLIGTSAALYFDFRYDVTTLISGG